MIKKSIPLILLSALLAACLPSHKTKTQQPETDTLLINGRIYTVNDKQSWAEAVAIANGKITFVGSNAEASQYRGDTTKVIDLGGKMAMPGLNDLHVHPIYGFTVQLFECVFPPSYKPDDIAKKITQCVEDNPEAEWIVGGQWETDFFVKHHIPSPRKWLDKVSGDKAVFLRDSSFHNRWANSKALALAGVTKSSPEVPGGKIVRDTNGEPNGLFYETAGNLVQAIIPDWTVEQYRQAAREGVKAANRFGITGLKDASTSPQRLKSYKSLDESGEMDVHLTVAITAHSVLDSDMKLNTGLLSQLREDNRGKHVNTDFVKIFMDGVPSASRTAAMIHHYLPAHDGVEPTRGKVLYPYEVLSKLIAELDRLGITVKVHAAGDQAVRVTLDAIEYTRKVNGRSGLRHEIAHAGFIDEADIPRFAELNATAEISPYIWFPSTKTESIIRAVGKRGESYFPVKTLIESGADVVAGSDWPAGALPSMNPWVGMEALISRRNPWGVFPGVLWPEQAISLEQALRIYTRAGAKALKLENATGSIEEGKLADIIVLNQNLFDIPVEKISDTQVEMTLFGGKIVHEQ